MLYLTVTAEFSDVNSGSRFSAKMSRYAHPGGRSRIPHRINMFDSWCSLNPLTQKLL